MPTIYLKSDIPCRVGIRTLQLLKEEVQDVPFGVVCVSANSHIYTSCKSSVSVNHLHIQIFYTYTYPIVMYIYILHLYQASVNTKIICKVTLSLGLLSPFHPKPLFQGYP